MVVSVILAAGKGTRMVSDLPKVLHSVMGMSLLEHMLEKVETLGCEPRVAVIGHGRDAIVERLDDRGVTWAHQEEQKGTGHAAAVGVKAASASGGDSPVLILNGDLPLLGVETLGRLISAHEENGADLTLLTFEKSDPSGYGRIVRDASSGKLTAIVEERDTDDVTRAIREINVGVYVFRHSVFTECYAKTTNENAQNEYYLTDVVVEAVRQGKSVETVTLSDETEILQVNSRRELAEVSKEMRRQILDAFMDAGVTIVDPDTTYIDKGVSIGKDTTVFPFTHIARGVEIGGNCEIGPFARLRPGTEIGNSARVGNFVEVKASRIGDGTKIGHLTYIGNGQIGEKVNVGAGTILANYDGKAKYETTIKDGAFIGSGTILVAPVSVGKGSMTGAGAVVTRNHDVADGEVVVGMPARPVSVGQKKKND